jgi:aspartokinase-like uncharacterized kinase
MDDLTLPPPGPCIVKLGGSLHDAPELRAWLAALARVPGPSRIVVPGGGPFADTVRSAQAGLDFDDLAAHRMAILAMQQYGLLLQAQEPVLGLAETEEELKQLPRSGAAVWLPWTLAGREDRLEASWDVTSDSLALWLACRLAAPLLLLVKSATVDAAEASAAELASAGVIDAAFPRLLPAFGGTARLVRRASVAQLPAALAGEPVGCLLWA